MNKKGSTIDFIVFLAIGFAAVVSLLVVMQLWSGISGAMKSSGDPILSANADNFNSYTRWTFDFGGAFFLLGGFIGAILLAIFARHHPVFAWFNVLLMIVLFLVSVPLSNHYHEVFTSDSLADASASMQITGLLMDNLPILVAVLNFILLLVMFGFKSQVSAV